MPSSETTDPVEIASKLLGDTLDADFAFWSAPTSEKYRTPVYRAWKQLQTARKLMSRDERGDAWASLRIIRDAIGEMFGPIASIESEEAVLLRGPEYHHEAEAIIAALARLHPAGEAVAWQWRYQYGDRGWSPWQNERRPDAEDLLSNNVLITEEKRALYVHPAPTAADTVAEDDPEPISPREWANAAELAEWHKQWIEWAARRRAAADTGLVERNPMPSGWKFRAEAAEQQLAAAREQIRQLEDERDEAHAMRHAADTSWARKFEAETNAAREQIAELERRVTEREKQICNLIGIATMEPS